MAPRIYYTEYAHMCIVHMREQSIQDRILDVYVTHSNRLGPLLGPHRSTPMGDQVILMQDAKQLE